MVILKRGTISGLFFHANQSQFFKLGIWKTNITKFNVWIETISLNKLKSTLETGIDCILKVISIAKSLKGTLEPQQVHLVI